MIQTSMQQIREINFTTNRFMRVDFQHPERELFGMNWLTRMIQNFQRYIYKRKNYLESVH